MPRARSYLGGGPQVLVATALVLVTASCTSGSEGGGTTTSTTTPPPPGASTTGAEATTTSTEASPGTADLVFTNGNVITMSDAAPRAEAVAITDDVISAVGDRETVEAFIGDGTQVIDLDGATVIPGLVDAHSHFFGEGMTQGIGAAIQDAEILSNGITTTAEFHTTPEILETVRGHEQAGELRVRTSLYLIYTDACGNVQEDWWREHPPTREPGEMLRIGGIKVFADGGSCNVPAVSYTYEDGSTGDLYFDVDGMESIIAEVEEAGYQVAVHALGDRAVATVLDAMERVIGDSGNPFRHRIDHSAVVSPDLYGRHQESGAVAVLFGAFRTCALTDANNDYLYQTPDEFASWEWPWRQLLDSNPETVFAWHADYPALPASLGANLAGFVTRVEGDCQPTPEMAAGTITVDEALHMMTMGSAYALGRDEVGSLESGKLADLVVLNQDPTAIDPLQLGSTEAVMTMVGGRVEFCLEGHDAICPRAAEPDPGPDVGPRQECLASGENAAAGALVSASTSLGDRPPELAVDSDVETGWGAGVDPEQWIELDLGQEYDLVCVRLLTDQFPAGRTIHRIDGGAHDNPGAELGVIDSETDYGEWLELAGAWDVRFLRITTLESPSWVAWLEIEAWGEPTGQ
jgi:predicted amidohydrolase YtcJ